MKNNILRIVCIIATFLLSSISTTYAQIPGCPIGSPLCPWSTDYPDYPITATVWNAAGTLSCTMEIYYCHRSCSGFKELYIRKIVFPNKACLSTLHLDLSSDVFIQQVLNALIIENPWETSSGWIHPCSTGVRSVYNVYKAACYQFIQTLVAGSFEACNNEWACFTSYSVCWDYEKIPAELNIVKGSTHTQYTPPCPETWQSWVFDTSDIPCSPFCTD